MRVTGAVTPRQAVAAGEKHAITGFVNNVWQRTRRYAPTAIAPNAACDAVPRGGRGACITPRRAEAQKISNASSEGCESDGP